MTMADREPRAAMVYREPRAAMVYREPRAAMADPGTRTVMADRVYAPPPPKSFLAACRPGNTQYGPAEMKVSWTGPAEMKVNWAGPAKTKASWTRPTLGGAREALILWGAGKEQALGGARVERNWTEAARRKVS